MWTDTTIVRFWNYLSTRQHTGSIRQRCCAPSAPKRSRRTLFKILRQFGGLQRGRKVNCLTETESRIWMLTSFSERIFSPQFCNNRARKLATLSCSLRLIHHTRTGVACCSFTLVFFEVPKYFRHESLLLLSILSSSMSVTKSCKHPHQFLL